MLTNAVIELVQLF